MASHPPPHREVVSTSNIVYQPEAVRFASPVAYQHSEDTQQRQPSKIFVQSRQILSSRHHGNGTDGDGARHEPASDLTKIEEGDGDWRSVPACVRDTILRLMRSTQQKTTSTTPRVAAPSSSCAAGPCEYNAMNDGDGDDATAAAKMNNRVPVTTTQRRVGAPSKRDQHHEPVSSSTAVPFTYLRRSTPTPLGDQPYLVSRSSNSGASTPIPSSRRVASKHTPRMQLQARPSDSLALSPMVQKVLRRSSPARENEGQTHEDFGGADESRRDSHHRYDLMDTAVPSTDPFAAAGSSSRSPQRPKTPPTGAVLQQPPWRPTGQAPQPIISVYEGTEPFGPNDTIGKAHQKSHKQPRSIAAANLISMYYGVERMKSDMDRFLHAQLQNSMHMDPRRMSTTGSHVPGYSSQALATDQQCALDDVVTRTKGMHEAMVELVAIFLSDEEKRYLGVSTHKFQTKREKQMLYQYAPPIPPTGDVAAAETTTTTTTRPSADIPPPLVEATSAASTAPRSPPIPVVPTRATTSSSSCPVAASDGSLHSPRPPPPIHPPRLSPFRALATPKESALSDAGTHVTHPEERGNTSPRLIVGQNATCRSPVPSSSHTSTAQEHVVVEQLQPQTHHTRVAGESPLRRSSPYTEHLATLGVAVVIPPPSQSPFRRVAPLVHEAPQEVAVKQTMRSHTPEATATTHSSNDEKTNPLSASSLQTPSREEGGKTGNSSLVPLLKMGVTGAAAGGASPPPPLVSRRLREGNTDRQDVSARKQELQPTTAGSSAATSAKTSALMQSAAPTTTTVSAPPAAIPAASAQSLRGVPSSQNPSGASTPRAAIATQVVNVAATNNTDSNTARIPSSVGVGSRQAPQVAPVPRAAVDLAASQSLGSSMSSVTMSSTQRSHDGGGQAAIWKRPDSSAVTSAGIKPTAEALASHHQHQQQIIRSSKRASPDPQPPRETSPAETTVSTATTSTIGRARVINLDHLRVVDSDEDSDEDRR